MDKELPLVSIVTPSLNQGRFIEETIISVKNQTYPNIEHIVMDGCSTDETLDILRKYNDSITWISEPDEGQSDAINKGWRMSSGEILAYLNSDDTYMPWAVETAVSYLNEHADVGMVYGDCDVVDENGLLKWKYMTSDFTLEGILCGPCTIPQPSVFLRRGVVEDVGYMDASLHMSMDLDLWIRIALKFRVVYIPCTLANFRLYAGTKTLSETERFWFDRLTILDKTFSRPDLPGEVRRLTRKAHGFAYFDMGCFYYYRRMMKEARPHLVKAMALSPFHEKRVAAVVLLKSLLGKRIITTAERWLPRLRLALGLHSR